MSARTVVLLATFVLWAAMMGLTIYELLNTGPSILVLFALVFVTVLGVGVFGALGERRR